MQPCRCSLRALELFIKDISGLTFRHSTRPIGIFANSPRRHFSKLPRLNALETCTTSTVNDEFVPFEKDGEAVRLNKEAKGALPEKVRGKVQRREGEEVDLDDDWHAEVEVLAPWPGGTGEVRAGEVGLKDAARSEVVREADKGAETTSVDFNEADEDANRLAANNSEPHPESEQMFPSTAISEEQTSDPPPSPQRSKLENRQARRLRRELAGTYRQEAEAKAREQEEMEEMEEEEEDRTESALRSIEAMDGEDVAAEGGGVVGQLSEDIALERRARKEEANDMKQAREKPSQQSRENRSSKPAAPKPTPTIPKRQTKEEWQIQKRALVTKFSSAPWSPRKRLSPDTITNLRALHSTDPHTYDTATLSQHFAVSPEAIRRILKTKWRPNEEEVEDRRQRWERRGEMKWTEMAKVGMKPPRKWRDKGIRTAEGERKREERKRARKRSGDVPWEESSERNTKSASLAGRIL